MCLEWQQLEFFFTITHIFSLCNLQKITPL
jgi:hypothetical protein